MLPSHAESPYVTNFYIFIRILGSNLKFTFLYMAQIAFTFPNWQKYLCETFLLKRTTGKQWHFKPVPLVNTCGLLSTSQIGWRGQYLPSWIQVNSAPLIGNVCLFISIHVTAVYFGCRKSESRHSNLKLSRYALPVPDTTFLKVFIQML